jgi:putative tryptophan/tyrosine transport system permease protein
MVLGGMALSNALVALAGALFTQTQGGADISMGVGTIVIGLAAVIVGTIVYRLFIALALNSEFIGLQTQDLNLVTAILVTIALILLMLKRRLFDQGGS